mmetsp:Transcript_11/g.22  ORF Transcript_11/g.22 Transcript_11/m.22 type:complete len:108 (+) Transcript_11:300-623(+)
MGASALVWNLYLDDKRLFDGKTTVRSDYGSYTTGTRERRVAVRLDMGAGTLSYTIDGVDHGVALRGLDDGKALRLLVSTSVGSGSAELLSYSGRGAAYKSRVWSPLV